MLIAITIWLNQIATAIANRLLAPLAWIPDGLSLTLIAAITGLVMLVVIKYTSHQPALQYTRNQIKANLLALSLFKDHLGVGFRVQGALLWGAVRLLGLSVVPMLVMTIPMYLLLSQLSLWFQSRPLAVGQQSIVTVQFGAGEERSVAAIQLNAMATSAARVTSGPVRVTSKNKVCWTIQAQQPGLHELVFQLSETRFTKEISIGESAMPVSIQRPPRQLTAVLVHPREQPFATDSPVQSIEIDYPHRPPTWVTGSDWWIVYWFLASMVSAFLARPFLKVHF